MKKQLRQAVRLPKGWKTRVRSAVLNAISLAKYSLTIAKGSLIDKHDGSRQWKTEYERLQQDLSQAREELRIKDARMAQLPPHRRPHYPPRERMAILELRAARSWSLAQTARAFLVTQATISSWMHRLDEQGPEALVQLLEPVNKFAEFVHYLVRQLQTLCPSMGKKRIAETLARAGLHLGTTTVGRIRKASFQPTTPVTQAKASPVVTAKYANHVWNIDLTTVPTASGYWTTWRPFSLPQRWPFCWWVAVILDHYSRRVMGVATFPQQPSSKAIQEFLGHTILQTAAQPKHLICDKGRQFWAVGFKRWCKRREIALRFGAVGKHGSIAVIEQFILTLKQLCHHWLLASLRKKVFEQRLKSSVEWYNEYRPHSSLRGRTPNEIYQRRFPANRRPRYESRSEWPRASPCAKPWALASNRPGAPLQLHVEFHDGHKDLPIVTIARAA